MVDAVKGIDLRDDLREANKTIFELRLNEEKLLDDKQQLEESLNYANKVSKIIADAIQ